MSLVTESDVYTPVAVPPIPEGRSRGRRAIAVVLTAVLGGMAGAGVTMGVTGRTPSSSAAQVAAPVAKGGAPLGGVADVAAAVLPSVVRIDVDINGPFGSQSGTGSGIIYRADGYILTNAHVVDGATTVRVTLASGDQLDAKVVGTALPSDDVAVVKVDRTGLKAAVFGSSSALNVGDTAVAVGSPFGLSGTVTAGVVSALHRNLDFGGGERFTDAIQTDAPINPGNSGGALADARGTVIGINTGIVGSNSGNVGVGFAIPIDIARRDTEQIIATGKATRPLIGISGQNVGSDGGARVQEVTSGSPAAVAGLRAGDIIVGIDDSSVHSMDDLISILSRMEVGRKVTVAYERVGRRRTASVTLAARS